MRRIIGIGSPFGADRLGWHAIDLLQGAVPPEWELLKLDRPGSVLVRYLQGAQRVVLIDALLAPGKAGTILEVDPASLALNPTLGSTHGFGLADALRLAAQLDMLPRKLTLIGIVARRDRPLSLDRQALLERMSEFF